MVECYKGKGGQLQEGRGRVTNGTGELHRRGSKIATEIQIQRYKEGKGQLIMGERRNKEERARYRHRNTRRYKKKYSCRSAGKQRHTQKLSIAVKAFGSSKGASDMLLKRQ